MDTIIIITIVIALIFNFLNGMNDAANSIATVVSTKVLPPLLAPEFRRLLPMLYNQNHNPTAGCSKAPRGLHFPLGVSRLCTGT